ncbi:hypothetical protein [Neolewinella litorea]|uniref:PH domain-containing protein n=1 Tax=Neolewinella litorea TaxID=2562452 RepID=A0A4S4NM40_9BACT|nr:hypothetical protein [Neolewinella litorea]THH40035.1 hypothetical protein E4021_10560 [Neolewinella litorea]
MPAETNTYTSLRGARAGQVLVVSAIVVIALTLLNDEPADPLIVLKTLLSLTAIGFLIHYGHTLNAGITLREDELEVRHLFGTNRRIHLSEVQRITVQETYNSFGSTRMVMTVFTHRDNIKIEVSDLDRSAEFIAAMEECGQATGFNVVYLDRNGQIARSLRKG